jgi:L-rhamnose-H+ transport protein
MNMDAGILLGIALIATGSFSAASFAVPFGKTTGWKWETYWMVFSVGSCVLFPLIACILCAPDFVSIFRVTPPTTLLAVFALGAVYGVGNLCFGLGLRYLGLSLGYALSLGLMLAIGTLIPPLIDGRLQIMIQESGGALLLMGVLVACVGRKETGEHR